MSLYPKFGFVCGVAGNHNGIGDHVRALDAAGIPATICTNDGTAGLGDALALINGGSTVPHVLLYRVVAGKDGRGGEHYSVPDYTKEPVEAAHLFWQKIEPHIADEVRENRQHVWLQVGNELRTKRATGDAQWGDLPASEWLGRWSLEMCKIGNAAGYKIAPWGCNSGEPRVKLFNGVDDWEQPAMLDFLRYCAENPSKAAVSLHEYSWETEDIWHGRNGENYHLIGRFQYLLDACSRHGIGWPQIIITEWGWEKGDVPEPDKAIADILQVGELYAAYPNVLGAAIWCLQTYQDGIHHKAQRLIAPLTTAMIETRYNVEPVEPPTAPPPTERPLPVEIGYVAHLFPQDTTRDEFKALHDSLYETRSTFMQSHDHAFAAQYFANENGRLHVYDPHRWDFDIVAWYEERGVNVVVEQLAPEFEIIDIVDDLPTNPSNPYPTRPLSQITRATIHHSGSVSTPEAIANFHVNGRGWGGIAYSFLIYPDGEDGATIYQTNYLTTRAVHDTRNYDTFGICLVGNFQTAPPTIGMQRACKFVLDKFTPQLPNFIEAWPHTDVPTASTVCPGNTWKSWWTEATGQQVPEGKPEPPPIITPPPSGKHTTC